MMDPTEFRNYCVIVQGGSGCLFQPATEEYSYILTAKHLIDGVSSEEIDIKRPVLQKDGTLLLESLQVLEVFLHNDKDKDAAILKIPFYDKIENLFPVREPGRGTRAWLAGYPAERQEKEDSYRQNELTIVNRVQFNYLEGRVDGNANQEDISGQSGGCIISTDGENNFLLGIQSQMAIENDTGTGRIEFAPIEFFDDIVSDKRDVLAELSPVYLNSFVHLKHLTMSLVGAVPEIPFTRDYLQNLTGSIVDAGFAPSDIKNLFNRRLLIFGQEERVLLDRGLWVSWLEFLIVLYIVRSGEMKNADLQTIFDETRLIFSQTKDDWALEMDSIVQSDFIGLTENSRVVIVATNGPADQKKLKPSRLVVNIGRVQPQDLQIDNSLHPLSRVDLLHLSIFQHITNKSATKYSKFNSQSIERLLAALKKDYGHEFS